ncbi:MAG TPA: cell wall-binding repeat-containing protein [Dermatophilaceae bacterium]|nr:cell wall-binding repeat-containing protein [Dermatophilaceae bacterium]
MNHRARWHGRCQRCRKDELVDVHVRARNAGFGADRYATAANVAASFPTGSPVFVAAGTAFPDALAGTAAAAVQHAAILLTSPTTLPSVTATPLSALAPSSITILGGTSAVSAAIANQLNTYSSTVARISGPDRYATEAAIAASVFPGATSVFITSGAGFADGLTGGPVAGTAGQPLLLATSTCLPAATAAVVAVDTPATVTLLGGSGVLGAGVESLTSAQFLPLHR